MQKIPSIILPILLFVFLSTNCTEKESEQQVTEVDILIENAMILDGTGKPAYSGYVAIKNDQIAAVGQVSPKGIQAEKTIDANGRYVTPGFIDLHSHGNPKKTPSFENFLAMGVTTITLGQDGSSPAVQDIKVWQDSVGSKPFGTNIAMFVGHGTLRRLAGIGVKRDVSENELNNLKSLLDENLKHCFGLSTGLEYVPGLYADDRELLEMAKIVGQHDRLIMSHMRNEDDEALFTSIDELIRQGEFAHVHIAHLKCVYGKGKQRADEILSHLKEARNRGINITADIYPYMASYTGIGIVFPEWAKTRAQFDKVKVSRRSELENYLRDKVNRRNGPQATLLGTAAYAGKTLKDLEEELNKPFEDILIDDIGPGGASGAYFVMDKELQTRLMADSLISFCSDGSPTGFHPRGHGTFARVIEDLVIEENVLSFTEAVRKMTSYAASILGLGDRGKIAVGYKADLLIFNPENVRENADYTDPFQLATGFDIVMVNGNITRENEKLNDIFAGRFLTPNRD